MTTSGWCLRHIVSTCLPPRQAIDCVCSVRADVSAAAAAAAAVVLLVYRLCTHVVLRASADTPAVTQRSQTSPQTTNDRVCQSPVWSRRSPATNCCLRNIVAAQQWKRRLSGRYLEIHALTIAIIGGHRNWRNPDEWTMDWRLAMARLQLQLEGLSQAGWRYDARPPGPVPTSLVSPRITIVFP